jgi:hypothetical protein
LWLIFIRSIRPWNFEPFLRPLRESQFTARVAIQTSIENGTKSESDKNFDSGPVNGSLA